jgi:hypothetical protein
MKSKVPYVSKNKNMGFNLAVIPNPKRAVAWAAEVSYPDRSK